MNRRASPWLRVAVPACLVAALAACDHDQPVAPSLEAAASLYLGSTRDWLAVYGPSDINEANVVVGHIVKSAGCPGCSSTVHAAIDVAGTAYDLGALGTTHSYGVGINNKGQVVGIGEAGGGGSEYSFLWTPDVPNGTTGAMQRLPDPPSGFARVSRINDAGQIVGWNATTGVLWSGGQVIELGSPFPGGKSLTSDINAYGQIVGGARDANGVEHAVLWQPAAPNASTGTFVILCPECAAGYAQAINDFGQVILSTGALWMPSSPNGTTGTIVALPSSISPTDINNRGDVSGYDVVPAGDWCERPTTYALLWRPTEPNGSTGEFTVPSDALVECPFSTAAFALGQERDGVLKMIGDESTAPVVWVLDVGASPTPSPTPPPALVASAGPAASASEGTPVRFDASGTTPLNDGLVFQWDFGDGATGTGVTPTHTYADNGQYAVSVTVTDGTGYQSRAATSATIVNVAPTASLRVTPAQVDQGSAYMLALEGASDVVADLPSLWFAFDCGDGRGMQPFGSATSLTCQTVTSGDRTVRGAVGDKDSGRSEYAASLVVRNVAPSVTIVGTSAAVSASWKIEFRFGDPGTADGPWSYTIDWGDGSTSGPVSLTTQGDTIAATHRYPKVRRGSADYTIKIKVVDRLGATGQATTVVAATS